MFDAQCAVSSDLEDVKIGCPKDVLYQNELV